MSGNDACWFPASRLSSTRAKGILVLRCCTTTFDKVLRPRSACLYTHSRQSCVVLYVATIFVHRLHAYTRVGHSSSTDTGIYHMIVDVQISSSCMACIQTTGFEDKTMYEEVSPAQSHFAIRSGIGCPVSTLSCINNACLLFLAIVSG